jgi:hypothetical protein
VTIPMMSKLPTQIMIVVITIISALAIIMASLIVTPAFAIKRFFNCMTDDANKNGQLTINDVNLCYDKEYHSGSFATHSHSASSSSGSSK